MLFANKHQASKKKIGIIALVLPVLLYFLSPAVTQAAMPQPTDIPSFDSTIGQFSGGATLGYFQGIDTDASGNVFVFDNSSRIIKYDSSGNYITEWFPLDVGCGSGAPNLWPIAVNQTTGNVYVADACNSGVPATMVHEYSDSGELLSSWATEGSGDGQLSSPRGIAVDASGNIYVADSNNNRIQKFDSDGTFLTKWGTSGTGNGQFNDPQGIGIDSSGNIYVADTGNDRIQKFDSDGTFLTKWGTSGTGNGQFSSVTDVSLDSSGNIYASDRGNFGYAGNQRIQKFDSSGTYLTKWGSVGTGDSQFLAPSGVALDSSANVYVADYGNKRVQKFDSSGTYLDQWGAVSAGADGQIDGPYGVTVDSTGNIYVADTNNNRIQKFDSSGTYLTKWGTSGTGNGQFNSPQGIALDSSGNVYVADFNNNRIQKFDSDGTFLTKWGSSGSGDGQFSSPRGITIDSDGNIYVADTFNQRIQKFDSDGTFLTKWGSSGSGDGQFSSPRGITIDSDGNIYVADSDNYRIQKFDSSGTYMAQWGSLGFGYGEFLSLDGVAVDAAKNIYTIEVYNSRIQKFSYAATTSYAFDSSPGAGTPTSVTLTTPSGTDITCGSSVAESSLVAQDTGMTYPLGLVDFCLTVPSFGATTTVTLTFETDLSPSDVVARKYSPESETYQDVPGATITETTLNSNPALQLTYDITDGGELDDDGIANGEILDPVGLAVAISSDSTDGVGSDSLADTGHSSAYVTAIAVIFMSLGVLCGARVLKRD